MTIRATALLDGRYRLERKIAVGGMGEVWEGVDETLDRAVAVKILRSDLADDEAFRRRFRAEARTAGRLPHAGIAAVYDYGETLVEGDGIAYLVMELVPGEPLSSIISEQGALGTDRTLDVVGQAARALHAAHQRGVVHRDVKPANLMVTPDGRVKVTDFGIARPQDHEPLTATGQVMGTAHYLAPELARGQPATPQSDVYALGVVAYECLAGHRPFEGDNQVAVATAHLREQPPPLPATIALPVRQAVAAAMEKDPARRIPGADAFAAALEGLRWRTTLPGAGTQVLDGVPGDHGNAGGPAAAGWGAVGGLATSGTAAVAPPPVPDRLPPPPLLGAAAGAATGLHDDGLHGPGSYDDGMHGGGRGGGDAGDTAALPLGPGGARRRPALSTPLIALIGLVLMVVLGALLTGLLSSDRPPPAPGKSPPATTRTPPASPTVPAVIPTGPSQPEPTTSPRPARSATSRSATPTTTPSGSGSGSPTRTAPPTPTRSTTPPPQTPSSSPTPEPTPEPSPTPSATDTPTPTSTELPGGDQ